MPGCSHFTRRQWCAELRGLLTVTLGSKPSLKNRRQKSFRRMRCGQGWTTRRISSRCFGFKRSQGRDMGSAPWSPSSIGSGSYLQRENSQYPIDADTHKSLAARVGVNFARKRDQMHEHLLAEDTWPARLVSERRVVFEHSGGAHRHASTADEHLQ